MFPECLTTEPVSLGSRPIVAHASSAWKDTLEKYCVVMHTQGQDVMSGREICLQGHLFPAFLGRILLWAPDLW